MFCSVWITISTSFPQRNVNDTEKLCLIKTIRNDQVLINYLRFLMTFRTIKADNGKFMGFDILGGLSRGRVGIRQKRVIRQLAANIKTWSENPQKGSPFNSDKWYIFTVKKIYKLSFCSDSHDGCSPVKYFNLGAKCRVVVWQLMTVSPKCHFAKPVVAFNFPSWWWCDLKWH